MAGAKKFGTFGGVFTPSILTILGVIMYMRLGWVVGNAGLYGTIIIIIVAHVISITTGLSISSIATDKKVGAGGVYYVLSRSLGLPIGGAIGATLFAGTALSIALYLVGFAESFNAYLGLDTTINGIRIGGSAALISLATIALISTAVAIKAQYFILAAIGLSLVSIFGGSWDMAPEAVTAFGGHEGVSMETVFAIFFPAVTGFTAGIAMSGDLKDPKRSIPNGTIAAIAVGFIVYIGLAVFIAFSIDGEALRNDYNILAKLALFGPAVIAGIWGATLSSALGGILGGPRILQAMSVDKITPKVLGKGFGKDNEPRNALIITFIIAECGILIGELDMIARVVSMFYLAAYGFINLSFFLESWASPDFNPSFKVKKWIGLVGFLATFFVMFQLDVLAMIVSFIVIGSIYILLQRKQLSLRSGDIWNSVWSSLVLKGLHRMDQKEDHKRNWKPNILLFSGSTETRPYLIDIARSIAGNVGMISNFHLIETPEAKVLFPKHKQSLQDPFLIEQGIFGRRQEVQNIYKGIETIASTYGFSGVEPNTVLLGWAKNTKDPLWFAQMTQKLIELDYNVLYLDYDWNRKFGHYQKIDIWWRKLKNNAELSLSIAKFISNSNDWRNASIRLFLINETNKEGFERKINQMLDAYRVEATVKVINNYSEGKSSYDLMKSHSHDADLIIAGIPDIPEGQEKDFVDNTTEMFNVLGTTLLVKTSSILGEDEASTSENLNIAANLSATSSGNELIDLELATDTELQKYTTVIAQEMDEHTSEIIANEIASFLNIYSALAEECRNAALEHLKSELNRISDPIKLVGHELINLQKDILESYLHIIRQFEKEDLPYLEERLSRIYNKQVALPDQILQLLPSRIKVEGKRMALKKHCRHHFNAIHPKTINETLYEIGLTGFRLKEILKAGLLRTVRVFSEQADQSSNRLDDIHNAFDDLNKEIINLHGGLSTRITNKGREYLNSLSRYLETRKMEEGARLTRSSLKTLRLENEAFISNWKRNQNFLVAHILTDITLQQGKLSIEQVKYGVADEVEASMFDQAAERLEATMEWLEKLKINQVAKASDQPEVNQSLVYEEHRVEELMSLAETVGGNLPDQLNLIDPDSIQNYDLINGEELETITIDGAATYSYLIYDKLKTPIEKHLRIAFQSCMEVLSRVQFIINQVSRSTNQIAIGSKQDLHDIIEKTWIQLIDLKQLLINDKIESINALNDIIQSANSDLNTPSLAEHAVRILPTVNRGSAKKGFKKRFITIVRKPRELVGRYFRLVTSKPENVYGTDNDQKPANDMHYALKRFVDKLSSNEAVTNALPFYYKQLFVGKPAPSIDQLHHREAQLEQAFSMLRSPNVDEHSIIVLGEPMSGKSFFSEVVAKKIGKENLIKIQSPVNGSTDIQVLTRTLQRQLNTNAKIHNLLGQAPEGTVFLFEDLELWWDRAKPDGKLIRQIIKLINQYKSKFTFILNCNVYAFRLMESQGLLDHLMASRIYLPNFDEEAMKHLLSQRHNSGGLRVSIKGKSQDISHKSIHKIIAKIVKCSGGNVGIALHQWIAGIRDINGDQIEIEIPKETSLPPLEDAEWLIVLSQFLIHKHLDAARLHKLFSFQDRNRAEMIIRELKADGIIYDIMGSTYKLNPLVLKAVISRAEQYNMI